MTMRDTCRHWRRRTMLVTLALCAGVVLLSYSSPKATDQDRREDPQWPAISQEAKPWTRWWWHGSAVDPASLTRQLEALRDAGIGGVEITPIYGVRGGEARVHPVPVATSGCACSSTRCARRIAWASASTWPPGRAGRSADRGSATRRSSRTIAHKTWTLAAGESSPSRCGCARLRSSGRSAPCLRRARRGHSSHSDRGPRRTDHSQPRTCRRWRSIR